MNEEFEYEELARRDPRYPKDAYRFVREALSYAADSLELDLPAYESTTTNQAGETAIEKHFTGQQLCEAIRRYANNQYGYMAKIVLKSWNINRTSCFGDLVFNMIDMGILKKSEQDRREDFDDIYNFDEVFETSLEISSSTAIF